MKKSIFLSVTLLLSIAFMQSCRKTDKPSNADIMSAEDVAVNQDLTEDIDLSADVAIQERGSGGSCPTVTLEKPWGTWPNKLIIDYGNIGCNGPNGQHLLRGKIIVEQTQELFWPTATRTLTFDNFFVDDIQVEGSQSWKNNGLDSNGNWSFTKTATDMVLTYGDGTSTKWNHTHTATLVEGGNSLSLWIDDVWSITGNSSGINREGQSFTSKITSPLIKKALCRWVSQGTVEVSVDDKLLTLDFGNGDCDRNATLTLPNGDTYTIKMKL